MAFVGVGGEESAVKYFKFWILSENVTFFYSKIIRSAFDISNGLAELFGSRINWVFSTTVAVKVGNIGYVFSVEKLV